MSEAGEWTEQPLSEEQREANLLWLMAMAPERPSEGARDRWGGAGSSHGSPTYGDQWFDRETGRCWVYRPVVR